MAIEEPINTFHRHPQIPIYLKLDINTKLVGPFDASIGAALTVGELIIYQEHIMRVIGHIQIIMLDHIGEGYGDSAHVDSVYVVFLESPNLDLSKILFKRGDNGCN